MSSEHTNWFGCSGLQCLRKTCLGLSLKQSFHCLHALTQCAEQRAHAECPAFDSYRIDEKVDEQPIRPDKHQENATIPPLITWTNIDRRQILLATAIWTIAALARRARVNNIPSPCCPDEVSCIASARLAWWGREDRGFACFALHGEVAEDGGEDAADPPCRGVDEVHPVFPEDGEGGERADDAVEN